MADKFNFKEVILKLKKIDISLELANIAKNEFLNNFQTESFGGAKWKEVQRRTAGTKAYKYPAKPKASAHTRPILIGTGRLRRDVAASVRTGQKNGKLSYTLKVQNPYGAYNNEGTNKLPKRQFVGMTQQLNKKLLARIDREFDKIW